jgi:prefoldin alpha subunit
VADAEELQQLAKLVEVNRSRMSRLSEQITLLEEAAAEHAQVLKALKALEAGPDAGSMIPLGAGVQLVVERSPGSGVVIDIGSGIQAERPLAEAIPMVEKRLEDIETLLSTLNEQFDSSEKSVKEIVDQFNTLLSNLQAEAASEGATEAEQESSSTEPTKRRRRSIGGDLTLDD